MSSGRQIVPANLQLNDYMTVTMITAVGYDYFLTLSKEINYIWCKPWTWVSTLFVLVRYTGLCTIGIGCLLGSSFLPGPAKTYVFVELSFFFEFQTLNTSDVCRTVLVGTWTFLSFLVAADVVMILRVWAMYSRSRLILGILLASFSLEILFIVLDIIIDNPPDDLPPVTIQMLTFSFCVGFGTSPIPPKLAPIAQIVHGTVTCILAMVQFVRQSLQMYRTTKRWQVNRYMDLLVKQGVIYFLFILALSLVAAFAASGEVPRDGWRAMALMIVEFVPLYTLTPRFIISIRELYERDTEGRCGGSIDTGFGLSSSDSGAGEMEMVFAGTEVNEEEMRTLN